MTIDKDLLSTIRLDAEGGGAGKNSWVRALLAEIDRLEREARNDAIAYRAAIEKQEEIRAELAGLRTGYDAQNEVIAELRKDAVRYRWLRDKQTFIWLIQDWFPGAEFTDVDAEIDVAMAKEASDG